MMMAHVRGWLILCGCAAALGGSPIAGADDALSDAVRQSKAGATIAVKSGTHSAPLAISRSMTLKGTSPDDCVLEITADRPAISVTGKADVVVDSLTIRWRLDSSDPDPGPATAISVKDANLTLRNCRIIAMANGKRSPSALMADGFSKVILKNCTIDGFEFAVNVMGGAEGTVTDCIVRRSGHCGLSVFAGSTLSVSRTIIAESAYHGLRSTGGTLKATQNLIINNKNRGIYLGNKSATATIRDNVLIGNTTGISCFARTRGVIERNVILNAEYAAIDSRDTCDITIESNILQGNKRGFVLFAEGGTNHVMLEGNTFWKNGADTEHCETPASSLLADPLLSDIGAGRFDAADTDVVAAGHGVEDTQVIETLWKKWLAATDE